MLEQQLSIQINYSNFVDNHFKNVTRLTKIWLWLYLEEAFSNSKDFLAGY